MFNDNSTVSYEDWKAWYPKVYSYFYKRVNAKYEVEELTAQVMNTAFMAGNVQNFQAYIWKVSHNYLVKYIQTKTITPMQIGLNEDLDSEIGFVIDEELEANFSTNYIAYKNSLAECINNSLLKPIDKQLLTLSIQEEKNSTEIAQILEIRADNVRKKLSRILQKLRSNCLDIWKSLQNTKRYVS